MGAFQLSLEIGFEEKTYNIEICLTFHVNLQLSINIFLKPFLNLYSKYEEIIETPNLLLKSSKFETLSEIPSNSYMVTSRWLGEATSLKSMLQAALKPTGSSLRRTGNPKTF